MKTTHSSTKSWIGANDLATLWQLINQPVVHHVLGIINKVCRRFFTVIFPNHMNQNTLYILRTDRHIPHCSPREMLRDTLQNFRSCKLARCFAHSPFFIQRVFRKSTPRIEKQNIGAADSPHTRIIQIESSSRPMRTDGSLLNLMLTRQIIGAAIHQEISSRCWEIDEDIEHKRHKRR